MSDMKCPFCQQKLDCMGKYTDGSSKWLCNKCGLFGDKKLFDEIIRTRKALEIALDKLKGIKAFYDDSYAYPHFVNWHIVAQLLANDAGDVIKEITALEQKDK